MFSSQIITICYWICVGFIMTCDGRWSQRRFDNITVPPYLQVEGEKYANVEDDRYWERDPNPLLSGECYGILNRSCSARQILRALNVNLRTYEPVVDVVEYRHHFGMGWYDVRDYDVPGHYLNNEQLIPDLCEAHKSITDCNSNCPKSTVSKKPDLVRSLDKIAQFACGEKKRDFMKYAKCSAAANDGYRDSNNTYVPGPMHKCVKQCGPFWFLEQYLTQKLRQDPSLRAFLGDESILDKSCQYIDCHLTCISDVLNDQCKSLEPGVLWRQAVEISLVSVGKELVKHNLAFLAPDSCIKLSGMSMELASLMGAQGMVSVTGWVAAAVILLVAVVLLMGLLTVIHRGRYRRFE